MKGKQVAAISVLGAGHVKGNKPCQDSSLAKNNRKKNLYVIAVSDGHGSSVHFRSERGSKMAIEVAEGTVLEAVSAWQKTGIKKLLAKCQEEMGAASGLEKTERASEQLEPESKQAEPETAPEQSEPETEAGQPGSETELELPKPETGREVTLQLKQLEKSILSRWVQRVKDDLQSCPFAEEELKTLSDQDRTSVGKNPLLAYGATLIVGFEWQDLFFGIQIGDGCCAAISDRGEVRYPIPEDPRCFGRLTTSLCNQDAIGSFRECICRAEDLRGVVLSTDGLVDSCKSRKEFDNTCRDILSAYEEEEKSEAETQVKDFLCYATKNGSQDDISVAVLFQSRERGHFMVPKLTEIPVEREPPIERATSKIAERPVPDGSESLLDDPEGLKGW